MNPLLFSSELPVHVGYDTGFRVGRNVKLADKPSALVVMVDRGLQADFATVERVFLELDLAQDEADGHAVECYIA